MKTLAAAVAAIGLLGAGMAVAAANPEGWDGQDGWRVWKALEPAQSAGCAARDCPAWKGGLTAYAKEAGVWRGRATLGARGSASSITYLFRGCRPDQTGCASVEIFFSTTNSVAAEALQQYRASAPACRIEATEALGLVGDVRLTVTQPLTRATSLASLQAARAKIAQCGERLMAF